jgi:hypothetical protein
MTLRDVLTARSMFVLPLLWSALVACGGSGSGGLFSAGTPDAGSTGDPDAGASLFPDSGIVLDGGSIVCTPSAVGAFKPTWKGPAAVHSGACTTAQMPVFFDQCLDSGSTPAACAQWVQANASCASCLQSDDTATLYGPVIWHSNHAYYTTNIAGCLAAELGDTSPTSCAASYQAIVECKETACSACLSAGDPQGFSSCESAATSECGKLPTTCVNDIRDAADPASTCVPPSGTSTRDAYLRLAPIFCGN